MTSFRQAFTSLLGAWKGNLKVLERAGVTGGNYGQLQVAGMLEVGGVAVELLDAFAPAINNDSQRFDSMNLSGAFSSVMLPGLLDNLSWDSSQLSPGGGLSVLFSGDVNGGGMVDGEDLPHLPGS